MNQGSVGVLMRNGSLPLIILAVGMARAELRLGIIGTDTSHVMHFSRMLNDRSAVDHLPGARVVAAYKGGSLDIAASYTRVDQYAADINLRR